MYMIRNSFDSHFMKKKIVESTILIILQIKLVF